VGPPHGGERRAARVRPRSAALSRQGAKQSLYRIWRRRRPDRAPTEQHRNRPHDYLACRRWNGKPRACARDHVGGQCRHDTDRAGSLVQQWKPIGWAEEQGQIRAGVGPFLDRRMRERHAYVARAQFPTRGDKAVRAQSIRGRMELLGTTSRPGGPGRDQAPAVAEVKARKNGAGFTTLETWLGEFDLLFLRRNNADPFVLVPWCTWSRLLERLRRG
jgi:hypothetical protein